MPTRRLLPVNRVIKVDLQTDRFLDLLGMDGFSDGAIAVDGDSVWVAEGLGGERVYRLEAGSGRVAAAIGVQRNSIAVAAGAGSVWILAAKEAHRWGGLLKSVAGLALYRIDPATDRVVAVTDMPDRREPTSPTAGSVVVVDGSVWVSTGDGAVARVDPASGRVVAEIPAPPGEAGHAYGFRLVTERRRLLLQRTRVAKAVAAPHASEPLQVTVWRLDPIGNVLGARLVDETRPGVVVALDEGGCWRGSTREDGVARCDPDTFLPVEEPRRIGHPAYATVTGHGTLWAFGGARTTAGDSRNITWITRIRP